MLFGIVEGFRLQKRFAAVRRPPVLSEAVCHNRRVDMRPVTRALRGLTLILGLLCLSTLGRAAESDALALDANIQARHLPFGGVLDPIFASPSSKQIAGYTRCGDSAIWTGHYLAAESFRYAVTESPDALNKINAAIAGLKGLVDVTGTDLLARCMVLLDSPYEAGIAREEAHNGIHVASPWMWVGNTSRDEYSGALFGLAVAYDTVNDSGIRSSAHDLITRLLLFLTQNNWSIVMPDGSISTSFLIRPDEMLAFLQVGRHVNPNQFSTSYDALNKVAPSVLIPVGVDVSSNDSYFKFNLDYINFYDLIRLDSRSAIDAYDAAYGLLRNHTSSHQNAFFDVIDRALHGADDPARDFETLNLLDQWLLRPRRDTSVDLRGIVSMCGSEACQPVPVPMRPPTDFLWQRDPFQLAGGGSGVIESSGIDYILPYWMARYYGVSPAFVVQSAAAATSVVAPDSLASLFGSNLTPTTAASSGQPLPETLSGVRLTITDTVGAQYNAPLAFVSPNQVNFLVPPGSAPGTATFTLTAGATSTTATGNIQTVAPTLFSLDGSGQGIAAATAVEATSPPAVVPVFECSTSSCVAVPIDLRGTATVYLTLYGTGIRNLSSLENVNVAMNGVSVPVLYAGAQPQFEGLDQVNVQMTSNLRGSGETKIVLTVDGHTSNTVTVNVE